MHQTIALIRKNRQDFSFTMKSLYEVLNIKKQHQWEWEKRQKHLTDNWLLLEAILKEERAKHPGMSLKKLYFKIQPNFIGRDKFIAYGMQNGYEPISYKKKPTTTFGSSVVQYSNLLFELKITGINQVWVSDTTYFKIGDKWYYITFIMDLYSRFIVGFHAAENLFAQANLKAFNMALQIRQQTQFNHQLIHHSDRGSQYRSLLYTDALKAAQINISMGKIVYENIHMERFNQTIKGEYLKHRNINSYKDLIYHLHKDLQLYNYERPHLALKMKSPAEFESYICNLKLCQRTPFSVFAIDSDKGQNLKNMINQNPNQLILPFL